MITSSLIKKLCISLIISFFAFVPFSKVKAWDGFSSGLNGTVRTSAVQSDGKIVIGGSFDSCDSVTVDFIARLRSDGGIDTTFKQDGTGFNNYVNAVVLQSDGKILVGGDFSSYNGITRSRIARLNSDGSLDTTFAQTGTGLNSDVTSMALQADGKILVGGFFTSYNGTTRSYVARLNSDGSLDTSFAQVGTGLNDVVNTLTLQSDGKILLAGYFTSYNSVTRSYVARLNSDGSLDTSFTQVGTGLNSRPNIVVLQPDGKILVGGWFTSYNGTARSKIARLNSDGSLDTSFSQTGDGLYDRPYTIKLQSDGKILVGGEFDSYNWIGTPFLVRLNSDGSLDTSFSQTGDGLNDAVYTIQILDAGKIFVGGKFTYYDEESASRVVMLSNVGSKDTAFALKVGGILGLVYASVIQSDGKVIVGGDFTKYNGIETSYLVRLNSDGSLDTTFVLEGVGLDGKVNTILLQPDGKILIGGDFYTYNEVDSPSLLRLNSNGSLDTTFVQTGDGLDDSVISMVLQPDGKIIVVGGFTSYDETTRRFIARINSNGSLDTSFAPVGTGFDRFIRGVALQADGKIIVGGGFTSYNGTSIPYLARLNSNGSLDTEFTQDGDGLDYFVNAIAIQSNGKILVGGEFGAYNGTASPYLLRLDSDGGLDTTFAQDGTGLDGMVKAIALQTDGKILLGGYFESYNGTDIPSLARLNTNGTLDTSFVQDGVGFNDYVRSVVLRSDGHLFVSGDFTSYNGNFAPYVILLNSQGDLDYSFIQDGIGHIPFAPMTLKVDSVTNPSSLLSAFPKFTAILLDEKTTASLTRYQIQVNVNSLFTGTNMWDSGVQLFNIPVTSSNTTPNITYAGNAIAFDGTKYYWRMRVWNSLGEGSVWSDVNDFTIGSLPLNSPTGLTISPSSYSNINNFRLSWTPGNARISSYEYKIGTSTTWISTTTTSINSLQSYKNGQNIIQVRSVDNLGNRSVAASISYYYDSVSPSVPTNLVATDTTFSWTESTDSHSGIYGYEYKVGDTTSWISIGSTSISSQLGLIEGENTLYVRAVDKAGNRSELVSIVYTYNNASKETDASSVPQMSFTREGSSAIQSDSVAVKSGESITVTISVSEITVEGDSVSQVYIEIDGQKTLLVLDAEKNVYTAQVSIPSGKSKGSILSTNQVVEYMSGERNVKGVNIVIDPYGYVYAKSGGRESRLENAKVSLYSYVNGNKELYTFSDGTKNPQNTNSDGEYSYFVPSGKYVLVVEFDGYKTFTSEVFEVSNGAVEQNIEMKKTIPLTTYLIGGGVVVLLCVGLLAFKKKEIDY